MRNTVVFPRAVTPHGLPIGGIFGLIKQIRNFLAAEPQDAIIFAQDWGRPAYRSELCPEYKAQREKERSPEEELMYQAYKQQCTYVHEVIGHLGMITARAQNWEGDDVIAALALQRFPDDQITILSSDKDFVQLVDGLRVHFYDLTTTSYLGGDPRYLLKRCLDPKVSDNLDGVPGVGPKKAEWLCDKANVTTPDSLVAWCATHAADDQLKEGQRKIVNAVLAEQQKVRANWQCTNLGHSAPNCDKELKFRRRTPDKQAFVAACREYHLRPVLEDLASVWAPYSRLICPV